MQESSSNNKKRAVIELVADLVLNKASAPFTPVRTDVHPGGPPSVRVSYTAVHQPNDSELVITLERKQ
ncbi:hypothetical protein ES705_15993 [subsurface metagenome]